MTAPFGSSSFGLAPFGSSSSTITIIGAWAVSTHNVRVILSSEPKHASLYRGGDALNPTSWSVHRGDTGDAFTVLGVAEVNATAFDLDLLEPLGNHHVTHTVASLVLLSTAGLLITNPHSADFIGLVAQMDPIRALELNRWRDRDLANPPNQSDAGNGFSGALVIGSDGDYETDDGVVLIRKLVLRRLSTPRGGFRHLKNYGLGLALNEPIPGGDIIRLKTDIEREVLLEPDVSEARARLMMDRAGVLIIQLRIRVAGTGASFDMKVQRSNGSLVEL